MAAVYDAVFGVCSDRDAVVQSMLARRQLHVAALAGGAAAVLLGAPPS
jgi:hypothetical protein